MIRISLVLDLGLISQYSTDPDTPMKFSNLIETTKKTDFTRGVIHHLSTASNSIIYTMHRIFSNVKINL